MRSFFAGHHLELLRKKFQFQQKSQILNFPFLLFPCFICVFSHLVLNYAKK